MSLSNIVQLFEVIESRAHHTMFLVLEYVSKGQILDRISDSGYKSPHCESGLVPLQTLRSYARDILRGLLYLHCMNIAHRDIKPENILLSSRNVCKLADFGVSELVQPDAPHNLFNKQEMLHLHDDKGTYHFYAPECVNIPKNGYSGFKADMWAVGITFLSCLTGKLPYRRERGRDVKFVIDVHPRLSFIVLFCFGQSSSDLSGPSVPPCALHDTYLVRDGRLCPVHPDEPLGHPWRRRRGRLSVQGKNQAEKEEAEEQGSRSVELFEDGAL